MSTPSDYYVARKSRLLKTFDTYVKYSRPVLVRHFGEGIVDTLIADTRLEYETLLPQLPYVGGKQPFTQFIVSTGMLLAVYRIARQQGRTIEQIGEIVYEISGAILDAYPVFLKSLFGKMNFSRLYLWRLRKRAAESYRRRYPDDYVYDFVEGDGQTFDYGVDYLECASCKFLAQQGASELTPYICPADILYSQALGWGLRRTMTLAEGAEKCDFRFKKGSPTLIAVPDGMQSVIRQNPGAG
jgi:hypothetical protein